MIRPLAAFLRCHLSLTSSRRQRRKTASRAVAAETLEIRTVPAVVGLNHMTPVLTNGILTVIGDSAANKIEVTQSNGRIQVLGKSFAASSVKTIVLSGEGGDDTLTVSSTINIPCVIYGGSGNDTIRSGSAADTIYAGSGSDTVFARSGNDNIYGGSGNDTVDGGLGSDSVLDASSGDRLTSASGLIGEGPTLTAWSSSSFSGQLLNEVQRLINQERTSRGLSRLTISSQLNSVASSLTKELNRLKVPIGQGISHSFSGTTGPTLGARLSANQVNYSNAAENNSFRKSSESATVMARKMMEGLMASSGHRANILNSTVKHMGLGLTGSSSTGYYLTQVFVKFAT